MRQCFVAVFGQCTLGSLAIVVSVFKCCPIGETLNSNHGDIETGLFRVYLALYRLWGTCSQVTAALLTRLETPHSPKIVIRQLYSKIEPGYAYCLP